MDIEAYGNSSTLTAVCTRLAAAGHALTRRDGPDALVCGRWRIDLSAPTPQAAQALAAFHGGRYADLAAHWLPAGERLGFAVYAGGAADEACAVADALAPLPGAWLDCGPAGSATFSWQCVEALRYAQHLGLLHGALPDADEWLRRQQQLLTRLDELAGRYLACHPAPAVYAPAFPAAGHPHFAQALALWLSHVLALRCAWQRLLEQPAP
ncbi:aspartate-semialdehyde dehydrogenase [Crenobacter intestini]|uniref:Uncharacterized protein n=1 Tax=Crenobacter intestini TaxID=2563443 RepID=A0A4T0UJJ1_9NEIS|nr:hypothetical protein [Crenobacter intestini]TIC78730.1 hypothetical protein E5K04_15060 [Crenobacter intestini]